MTLSWGQGHVWSVVLPQTEPVLMSKFSVTIKDCVYAWDLGPHLRPFEVSKTTLQLVYADLSYLHCRLGSLYCLGLVCYQGPCLDP